MGHSQLVDLTAIPVLGILAVWAASRLRMPSILLLLFLGLLAGPITGLLRTEDVFGELLLPIVSLSVGVILFEGGLSLKLRELPHVGPAVGYLITLGATVTGVLGAVFARLVLGLAWPMAALLGSILVVTGPTVIIPLLRDIRPHGKVGRILKWEGIIIDPIGAVMAVLIFEAVFLAGQQAALSVAIIGILRTLTFGLGLGAIGAGVLYVLLRRYWIPDYLQSPFALMLVISIFTASNLLQAESGLLATTVMGVLLSNQGSVPIKHIATFKENLQVLLISGLFILLASRLDRDHLVVFSHPRSLAYVALMMLVVRPAAVWLSTLGVDLSWRERVFLSWMAPRGIVAASVSSLFAIRLAELGVANSDALVAMTFLVIAATVTIYGLTAPAMARRLGLSDSDPQGVMIIGAHGWARRIAGALAKLGYRVLLIDTNWRNIRRARMAGLNTEYASALAQTTMEELNLAGIGRLLALTSNDEVNSLAALHFSEVFDRGGVFQLAPHHAGRKDLRQSVSMQLRGRILFDSQMTFRKLDSIFDQPGTEIKFTKLSRAFGFDDLQRRYAGRATPIFLRKVDGRLLIYAGDHGPIAEPGDVVVSLLENRESIRRYV
jgi:NhaP-type Na+/H+ or K+/H+ antiporter